MGGMIRALPLALLPLLLLSLAGCATSTTTPSERTRADTTQVRCLAAPHEYPSRPLFFLFCAQSP